MAGICLVVSEGAFLAAEAAGGLDDLVLPAPEVAMTVSPMASAITPRALAKMRRRLMTLWEG